MSPSGHKIIISVSPLLSLRIRFVDVIFGGKGVSGGLLVVVFFFKMTTMAVVFPLPDFNKYFT